MRFSKTTKTLSILYIHQKTKHKKASTIFGLATEKRDLRTYANSEDPDQPAHPLSLGGFFAVPLHNIWTLLKIKTYSEDFDPTCGCANWSGASPFVYALRLFYQPVANLKYIAVCITKTYLYNLTLLHPTFI